MSFRDILSKLLRQTPHAPAGSLEPDMVTGPFKYSTSVAGRQITVVCNAHDSFVLEIDGNRHVPAGRRGHLLTSEVVVDNLTATLMQSGKTAVSDRDRSVTVQEGPVLYLQIGKENDPDTEACIEALPAGAPLPPCQGKKLLIDGRSVFVQTAQDEDEDGNEFTSYSYECSVTTPTHIFLIQQICYSPREVDDVPEPFKSAVQHLQT